jgi:hypothetical protein
MSLVLVMQEVARPGAATQTRTVRHATRTGARRMQEGRRPRRRRSTEAQRQGDVWTLCIAERRNLTLHFCKLDRHSAHSG